MWTNCSRAVGQHDAATAAAATVRLVAVLQCAALRVERDHGMCRAGKTSRFPTTQKAQFPECLLVETALARNDRVSRSLGRAHEGPRAHRTCVVRSGNLGDGTFVMQVVYELVPVIGDVILAHCS